jgi:hypothetical protein
MIVKPAEGLTVFDPVTARPLPPEGITIVEGDLHWARLELDRDVTVEPDPDILAPVLDANGSPVDPPAGDIAANIASPGKISVRSSSKGEDA